MYVFSIARSSTPEEDENEIGCDDNLDALGDVIATNVSITSNKGRTDNA